MWYLCAIKFVSLLECVSVNAHVNNVGVMLMSDGIYDVFCELVYSDPDISGTPHPTWEISKKVKR